MSEIGASVDECIMIGDSLRSDIAGATNAGLKAIWFNQSRKKDDIIKDKSKYIEITKFEQIKENL